MELQKKTGGNSKSFVMCLLALAQGAVKNIALFTIAGRKMPKETQEFQRLFKGMRSILLRNLICRPPLGAER